MASVVTGSQRKSLNPIKTGILSFSVRSCLTDGGEGGGAFKANPPPPPNAWSA